MSTTLQNSVSKVSKLAQNIIGSEIIKLAGEVNEKIKQGEKIYNLTIGDFNPKEFPIPSELKQYIVDAYSDDQTNYPAADGMLELRNAVSNLLKERGGLDYKNDEILIAGGARPVIYSIFRALVDADDTVVFAVPSWNNNHYTYLNHAKAVVIEATPEQNFMPSAKDIKPFIQDATLVALCSPQNPTGTVFSKEGLEEICDLILEENKRRGLETKPVYLMYDQIYWALTHGNTQHYNPVVLRPEMKNYTVFVDGISKSLAATGVRVGWSMGPKYVIDKMKAILTHVGAWAPKAEQVASAKFLADLSVYDKFLVEQKNRISVRLEGFYKGFQELKNEGYKIDAIPPQAAIYLTIKFDLHGMKTSEGKILATTKDITKYILDEAKLAVVPFYCFGADDNSPWYRMSVGTCKVSDVQDVISNLRNALKKLS
ncbi:MAG: aminotransferase class I/II-fold pyridoxal phosphate-dependent enzyme [Bacteroidia bacterium]|nr:aminotransferase class I/II-fold pyridoxal phosphate-dependent enzyme [Bacteroidia bacterium]